MNKEKQLSKKHAKFCKEYLISLNATQAYIKAGYSGKGADVSASRLLRDAKVSAFIANAQKNTEKDFKIDRAKVLKMVLDMAEDGGQENNRRGALDMLMKHTGLYEKDNKLDVQFQVIDPFSED